MLKNMDSADLDLAALGTLRESSDSRLVEILHRLRANRQLASTVRALNRLLGDPRHRVSALAVLRRIGLEHGG